MATASQEMISLAPDLAATARAFAQQRNCSLDDLAAEAIRSYLGLDPQLTPVAEQHRQHALDLGLTLDEYAVRLVKETRAELRVEREKTSAS